MKTLAPRTPTSPDNLKRINAMFDSVVDTVHNLAGRWQDEREYEDIADYAKPLRPMLPTGFNLRRMTKRPFGFEFDIGTGAVYSVFASATRAGWKRIS